VPPANERPLSGALHRFPDLPDRLDGTLDKLCLRAAVPPAPLEGDAHRIPEKLSAWSDEVARIERAIVEVARLREALR